MRRSWGRHIFVIGNHILVRRHFFNWYMMTSSSGNIFRVTGPLCGENTGLRWIPRTQRLVKRSFHVLFDLHPIKLLSKHSRGWWFETLLCPLWCHRNDRPLAIISGDPEVSCTDARFSDLFQRLDNTLEYHDNNPSNGSWVTCFCLLLWSLHFGSPVNFTNVLQDYWIGTGISLLSPRS